MSTFRVVILLHSIRSNLGGVKSTSNLNWLLGRFSSLERLSSVEAEKHVMSKLVTLIFFFLTRSFPENQFLKTF